jgi:hypothetical protein
MRAKTSKAAKNGRYEMTIREFEKKVWQVDTVRIVIRDRKTRKVSTYRQKRAAQENWNITGYLRKRISPLIDDREVVVLDGNGKIPNGRTLLKTIRLSYN